MQTRGGKYRSSGAFWRQIRPVRIVPGTVVRGRRAEVHFGPGEKTGWTNGWLGVGLRRPQPNAVGTSVGRLISAPEVPAEIQSHVRTAKEPGPPPAPNSAQKRNLRH